MNRFCVLLTGFLFLSSCSDASYDAGEVRTNSASAGSKKSASPESDLNSESVAGDRKIIYQADVELIVKDFSETEEQIPVLIKEHRGYLSNVSINRLSGEKRVGKWEARIPTDQFDDFRKAVSGLGLVVEQSQTAQDVTEKYVDLESRISNQKKLEERILELLKNRAGKISDIIEVEKELSRVRGVTEQLEGQLRLLKNKTDLSTIRISAREDTRYVPPKKPGFFSKVSHAWNESLSTLQEFGETLAVLIVYFAPWLVILLVIGIPAYLIRRRLQKKQKESQTTTHEAKS